MSSAAATAATAASGLPARLCGSRRMCLLRMRTSLTMSSRRSFTIRSARTRSSMSSPSMSRRKSWPWMPPPLENSISKSNLTLLSIVSPRMAMPGWYTLDGGAALDVARRGRRMAGPVGAGQAPVHLSPGLPRPGLARVTPSGGGDQQKRALPTRVAGVGPVHRNPTVRADADCFLESHESHEGIRGIDHGVEVMHLPVLVEEGARCRVALRRADDLPAVIDGVRRAGGVPIEGADIGHG